MFFFVHSRLQNRCGRSVIVGLCVPQNGIAEHDQCQHYLCIAFSDLIAQHNTKQKRLNGSSGFQHFI